MAIEGSLADVGLADICQLLAMGRKTGCLSLTDRSNFGYIYFERGRVIYASILNRPDRLGELLVRNEVISSAALSRAMESQAHRKGARLGEILVRDGALSEEELHRYIRLQIEEAVYHLFAWSRGSFHFDPDQRPDEEGLFLVDIPAESLLLEGARRVDEWSLIEKKIPSLDLVFTLTKDPAADPDLELEERQRRILPLIDGIRTVEEIVADSGLVEFEAGKALYGLVQAGFAERAGKRTEAALSPTDGTAVEHLNLGVAFYRSRMFEDAEREFESVLESSPDNPRALFRLGLIAFRDRRLDAALAYFDRMPESARDSYAVLRNRALILEMMQRYDEALGVLDRCRELRPEDPHLWLARGVVLLRAGDVGASLEALHRYRSAPELKTPEPLYYATAVLVGALAGRFDWAVSVGREGLGHHPDSGPLLVNTGAVLEHKGEMEAAQALYIRAIGHHPPPAQAHKALGDQAYARGDREQARFQYEKAVKLNPRLGDDVYLRLGAIAHRDGEVDVARLLWRRALEINPDNGAVKANLELLDATV
jgi:tetratricopeptide (TPR) repeat protein